MVEGVSQLVVRPLTPADADAYVELRREALDRDPLAFAASPEDDRASDVTYVRQAFRESAASVLLGAFCPTLIGAVGLYRDAHRKGAHKAHVWGMYVRAGHRGTGVGEALLRSVLAHARSMPGVLQVHLAASETAEAALRLYVRHGFQIWGTVPKALYAAGRFVAEHHLVHELA